MRSLALTHNVHLTRYGRPVAFEVIPCKRLVEHIFGPDPIVAQKVGVPCRDARVARRGDEPGVVEKAPEMGKEVNTV